MTPSPSTRHQIVSANLGTLLDNHVRAAGLGRILYAPMDVILDKHTVFEPDILFVSAARAAIIRPHAIVGPPDLAVEILWPSTQERDKGVKAKLCARFGVEHYWLVDPLERVFETFELRAGIDTYVSTGRFAGATNLVTSVFPELTIDVTSVRD